MAVVQRFFLEFDHKFGRVSAPPSYVVGHSQESCNAKKAVKNCYFTTGLLLTIKPEKEKRTTDRFRRIGNFICMKNYTKFDIIDRKFIFY